MVPPPPSFSFSSSLHFRAVESLTLRTRKEKTHHKKPATQATIVEKGLTSFKKDNSANFSWKYANLVLLVFLADLESKGA